MSLDGHGHSPPMPTAKNPALRWINHAALQDAINNALPQQPQPARLPPAFRPAHTLTHPPPFFDNLTRSTLPTSSLSPPPDSPRPIPPPPRSSIDSLRRFSSRSLSAPPPPSIPALDLSVPAASTLTSSISKWWSQSDSSKDALVDEPSAADAAKKYSSPKNPVVFCHGLLGFDSVTIGPAIAPFEVVHWRGIKEVLEENGTEVLITRVPATSSPVDRAKVLEARISEVYPGRSVHLIGHSMGGLDCRYLTTHLTHRKFRVLSITTIATPHRGSSFADHFLTTVGRTRMPSVLSLLDLLPNGGGDGAAFECLTVDSMRKFNEETPDVPGVRYFSWGATYEPGLIDTWKWPHSVILEKEGPNDGLVSVESSKWGTYLGTLSQVNHLDLVGWVNTARYKWAEITGKEIKFRPATFYLGIVDMLAREVEGAGTAGDADAGGRRDASVSDASLSSSPISASIERVREGERERMVQSMGHAGAVVHDAHAPPSEPSRIPGSGGSTPERKGQVLREASGSEPWAHTQSVVFDAGSGFSPAPTPTKEKTRTPSSGAATSSASVNGHEDKS